MRVLLAGYYGFGNVGDEAILAAIAEHLPQLVPGVEIQVLSANPEETARVHGLPARDRWNLWQIVKALRNADILIEGGGGLIQDSTSAICPAYYLGVLTLARWMKRPYIVFCQGVGPLHGRLWKRMTVRAFAGAAGVVVRDRESAETLGEWGLRRSVEVAADPAILLSPAPPEQVSKWLWRQGVVLSDDFAVLVPRLVDGYADVQFGAAAMLAKRERQMVLVPFQSADEWLAREIEGQVTNAVVLETPGDPRIAAGLIALSKEVIAIRLHALLFAAAAGVPALGIAYDPKVSRFCDEVGYPHVAGGNLADLENFMNECGCTESTPDAERVHRYRAQAGRAFEILAQILTEKAQR